MTADYSTEYRKRWKERDVDAFLRALCPREDVLGIAAECVATSIAAAHQLGASNWGVTRKNGMIRVNVGRMEAILWASGRNALKDLRPGPRELFPIKPFLALMVDRATLKGSNNERLPTGSLIERYGPFDTAPDSRYFAIPTDDASVLRKSWDAIRVAHLQHLELADKTPLNPKAREFHHPGLVDGLSKLTGRAMPQPGYVRIKGPEAEGTGTKSGATGGPPTGGYLEGAQRDVVQSKRERDPRAREDCLRYYGSSCSVCDQSMSSVYGSVAEDVIHVHHLNELASDTGSRLTDPIRDLRPVCPNCHSVLHLRTPSYSIDEVREFRRAAARDA